MNIEIASDQQWLSLLDPCFRIHSPNSNDLCSPLSTFRTSMVSFNNNAIPPPVLPTLCSNLYLGSVISVLWAISFSDNHDLVIAKISAPAEDA